MLRGQSDANTPYLTSVTRPSTYEIILSTYTDHNYLHSVTYIYFFLLKKVNLKV